MNTHFHTFEISDQKKFSTLKKSIDRERSKAVNKRIKEQPFMTDMEYISGAFLEMYEPYLKDVVCRLFEKGYAIETSSGFNNIKSQYQSLDGNFVIDYVTRNKLDKKDIKIREKDGFKSLVYWAENLDLDFIISFK